MIAKTPERDVKLLNRLIHVIKIIKDHDRRLSLGHIHLFLLVAVHEGRSQSELAVLSSGTVSGTSRYLLDLSEKTRTGDPGYGLLIREADPLELRKNRYSLSAGGRQLIAHVEAALK